MTVRTGICVLVMTASAAWAQAPMSTVNNTRKALAVDNKPAQQKRENTPQGSGVSSSGKQSASPKASAAGSAAPKKTVAKPSSRVQQKTVATGKKPAGAATEGKAKGTEEAPGTGSENAAGHNLRGRRDPFVTVIRSQPIDGPNCAMGKKCIDVDKTDLKGIVRSQAGMIALVQNQQRKTYFLHENDPVYRGRVVKINPDSVVFQQTVVDRLGKQSTKDVVKRLSVPSV